MRIITNTYSIVYITISKEYPCALFSLTFFVSKAKDCGALISPINGSLFGNLTTYPHKVRFVCDEGFNLRGSKIRKCLSTGNWSGNNTFCEGICVLKGELKVKILVFLRNSQQRKQ